MRRAVRRLAPAPAWRPLIDPRRRLLRKVVAHTCRRNQPAHDSQPANREGCGGVCGSAGHWRFIGLDQPAAIGALPSREYNVVVLGTIAASTVLPKLAGGGTTEPATAALMKTTEAPAGPRVPLDESHQLDVCVHARS